MLIKALNEYYDILARNDKVCKDGFSRQNITHMIMLRKDGTVSDIINVEQESEPDSKGKTKLQPISVVLPERTQKPGIDGNMSNTDRYTFSDLIMTIRAVHIQLRTVRIRRRNRIKRLWTKTLNLQRV